MKYGADKSKIIGSQLEKKLQMKILFFIKFNRKVMIFNTTKDSRFDLLYLFEQDIDISG
jgi:hypothetical protein